MNFRYIYNYKGNNRYLSFFSDNSMDAWTFEEFQKDFYENNKQKPKDKSLYTLYLKSLNTIKKDSKVPEEVKDYVDDLIAVCHLSFVKDLI